MFNFIHTDPLFLYSIGLKVFAIRYEELLVGSVLFSLGLYCRLKINKFKPLSLLAIFIGLFICAGIIQVS